MFRTFFTLSLLLNGVLVLCLLDAQRQPGAARRIAEAEQVASDALYESLLLSQLVQSLQAEIDRRDAEEAFRSAQREPLPDIPLGPRRFPVPGTDSQPRHP